MLNKVIGFALFVLLLVAGWPQIMKRLEFQSAAPTPQVAALVEERPKPSAAVSVAAPARVVLTSGAGGHYRTDAEINGRPLSVLVDTGATSVALRYSDARNLGLVVPGDRFDVSAKTANGMVKGIRVRINSIRIGGISVRDVDALVLPDEALSENLLGMSFLGKLHRFEANAGRLILED